MEAGEGGRGRRGEMVGQFPATRRLLLNARTGHRSREIQLQSHTYCTRKSSWTIALILQRRRTIAKWHTGTSFARRYNCSAVVAKVGFRRGWLVANRADVPTQSNSWNFRVPRESAAILDSTTWKKTARNWNVTGTPRGNWIRNARMSINGRSMWNFWTHWQRKGWKIVLVYVIRLCIYIVILV